SIMGPYTGVRTLLPNSSGKYKGPGHIGLLKENGCNFVSTHYYDTTDNGNAKLDILKMTYSGGWPTLTRDFTFASCGGVSDGLYRITSRSSGKDLMVLNSSTNNGAAVVQYSYAGSRSQQWYVINHGTTGNYSLINANSLQSLDVFDNSTNPGTIIAQWPYWGGN